MQQVNTSIANLGRAVCQDLIVCVIYFLYIYTYKYVYTQYDISACVSDVATFAPLLPSISDSSLRSACYVFRWCQSDMTSTRTLEFVVYKCMFMSVIKWRLRVCANEQALDIYMKTKETVRQIRVEPPWIFL